MARSSIRVASLAVLLVGLHALLDQEIATAALLMNLFRASDGTAYQVIRAEERFHITTIAGSAQSVGSCFFAASSGEPASAVAGADPVAGQALHPYAQTTRTGPLTPNDLSVVSFDPHFGGRVTLGTGAAAVAVCHEASDCSGLFHAALVPLDFTDGVPPACIANGVSAQCDGGISRNVIAFGLPATGNPPVCDNPADVTVDTTICAPEPIEGFLLGAGQAIVIAYDTSLAGLPFTAGSGAFRISEIASTPPCPSANQVLSSASTMLLAPPLPLPTATPTGPTPVASDTPTSTPRPTRPTRTPIPIETRTRQPTNTARPTRTPISEETRTRMPTSTARPTRTPITMNTRTRPPISTPRPTRTPLVVPTIRPPRPTRTPVVLRTHGAHGPMPRESVGIFDLLRAAVAKAIGR